MLLWEECYRNDVKNLLIHLLDKIDDIDSAMISPKTRFVKEELIYTPSKKQIEWWKVKQTLEEMKKYNSASIEDFEKIYVKIKNRPKKNINDKSWSFYLPLYLLLDFDLNSPIKFRLLGKKCSIVKTIPYKKKYLKEKPDHLIEYTNQINEHLRNDRCPFLKIETEAPRWELAWEKCSEPFKLFRALCEFSWSIHFMKIGTRGQSLASIPHPNWMFIKGSERKLDGIDFLHTTKNISASKKVDQSKINLLTTHLRFFRKMPDQDETIRLLFECLLLYSDGMSEIYEDLKFLRFWQVLEKISLSEPGSKTNDTMIKRVRWICEGSGLTGSGFKYILEHYKKLRNEMIHTGISQINESNIHNVKKIVDLSILWLFGMQFIIPSIKQLEHVYKLKDICTIELNAIAKSIDYINNSRKRK